MLWSFAGTTAPSGDPGTLGGSAPASWAPLTGLLVVFALGVLALAVAGRSDPGWGPLRHLARVRRPLEDAAPAAPGAAATLWVAAFAVAVRSLQGPGAGRHPRPVARARGRAGRPAARTPG
jgi:hypothetical protein